MWRRRHRAVTVLLWLHVPALALFGLLRGLGPHVLVDAALPAAFALIASNPRSSRTVRSIAGSLGLVSCSALLVHIWGGTIEAHFSFFVVVSLLMLYQDWIPFLIAIAFVVLHHGVLGTLMPDAVFAHDAARQQPWMWALVHGGFVVAAAAANVASWRANEQLLHDPLTGLATRLVLDDRLRRARRPGAGVAVLFIDLDRFKVLNDSLGHAAGDHVLQTIAQRLRGGTRQADLAVRFGGDEFVVFCEDVADAAAAFRIAEKLCALLREPIEVEGHAHVMTVSVGVAFTADAASAADHLVRDADVAMYRAKELGSNRCELYDAAMHAGARRRLDVEEDLRGALERGELRLHYQPEVDLASGCVGAVEALLRWEHPTRGLLGPGEFICVAEESGLIVPIGAWVLEEATRQAAAWPGEPVLVRVNVSARQLREPHFVATVQAALAASGLPARALCLELTESVLMEDLDHSAAVLRRLRALGTTLALDDFGTGYSSLAYLRSLEVDRLKIDRSFMAELDAAPAEQTIVAAIVGLARGLGLAVTAEGIETQAQLACVQRLGCDAAQGFLLARPAPPHAVEPLLRQALIDVVGGSDPVRQLLSDAA
jgi:diguanylate cyclase